MADQALMDFLSGPELTKLAGSEAIKSGLPSFIPPAFLSPSGTRPTDQNVMWSEVTGTRKTAQIVNAMSPSKRQTIAGAQRRLATAVCSKEHIVLDQTRLAALQSSLPGVAEAAQALIVQDMKEFRSRFDNLRLNLVCSALSMGVIYYDKDGNLLPSSSNAVNTIDFSIPAGNKSQLDILGSGSIIGASWATATTNIPLHLEQIRMQLMKKNGYNPTTILYGEKIPTYLATNNYVKDWLVRNQPMNNAFLNNPGQIPQGMLGYNWYPVAGQFWVDGADAVQSWWGEDALTILPDPSPDWYEFVEAGMVIPNEVAHANFNVTDYRNKVRIVNGFFSYAEMMTDPLGVKIISGDSVLPLIKVPGAVLLADVTP